MKSGKPIHPTNGTGSAPDAAATPEGVLISFDLGVNRGYQTTSAVFVTNRDAANTLEISFANGRDKMWFAIAPKTSLSIEVMCHNCRLRGSSGAVALYSIMGIVA
jgi:hypothetical protein